MSTVTTITQILTKEESFPIKLTSVWVPLKIEGMVPTPYSTPKGLKVIPKYPTFYGVILCRNTGLKDQAYIEFSRYFGELDDIKPYVEAGRINRLTYPGLFDAGNIDVATGKVAPLSAAQVVGNRANELFHVDSSFNGCRAGHYLLLAWVLLSAGTGGATEWFSDTRTTYDDLSDEKKKQLDGLVANHSLFHSRKKAVPHYFKDLNPKDLPLSKHKLVQVHEWSGRMNLYVASYSYSIDGMTDQDGNALIEELLTHTSKPKYQYTVEWYQPGDMIIWDNTSVQHRAIGGSFEGKYPRDMRKTTVKDMSSTKFGLNRDEADWRVRLP